MEMVLAIGLEMGLMKVMARVRLKGMEFGLMIASERLRYFSIDRWNFLALVFE